MTEQEIIKEWLRHPGTKLITRKMRAASKGVLRKYDRCEPEKLIRLQMLRQVINSEIPRMIDGMLTKENKWDWRNFLGLRSR